MLATGSFVNYLRLALRVSYVLFLVLAAISQGAVREIPLHIICAGFFLLGAVAIALSNWRDGLPKIVLGALSIAAILASWGVFQSTALPGNAFASPIWSMASEVLGPLSGTISLAPADTIEAILPITLPFIVFAGGYLIFESDERAVSLLAILLTIATAGAVIAIFQYELSPDRLLFSPKIYYLDSLTAYFVNRNTSATYLAINLILAAGFSFYYFQSFDREAVGKLMSGSISQHLREKGIRLVLSLLSFIILLLALMLTKSRAGVGSGVLGLLVFALIAAYYGPYRRRKRHGMSSRKSASLGKRLTRIAAAGVIILALTAAFGGRAILRAEVQGAEDQRFCMYPAIVELFSNNWRFGTGYGTFEDAFTAYRPPECGISGIFDRAHNFYLEAGVTAGVIFLPLLVAVILTSVLVFSKGIRTRKAKRWAPMVGIGALAAVLAHSAIDFSIQIPGFAAFFAALIAGSSRMSLNRSV